LISRDEFDKAEAALKALQATALAGQAAITNAALNVEFTEIRAPIDGRAGNLLVHAGNIVQAGSDVLVTLNQLRPIYAAFAVPEQHLAEIKTRLAEAKLFVEASAPGLAQPPRGELTFVDNAVDASTGTIPLKAVFANADNALWPGQFVAVVLKLKELPGAVVVPAPAVQTSQSGEFVFVVKPNQTVEMRPVKTGLTREGETVVESGLAVGETVVTDGQLRLVPGFKVNIRPGLTPTPAPAKARPAKGT
jgi:multidrug efflux system membrane fusion protein